MATDAPDTTHDTAASPIRPAARLLAAAAAPERHHLGWAVLWLALAAGLEALGPLAGKALIDHYLLPRDAALAEMAGLLLGALAAGVLANWLRFRQLLRLAGLAMRSVQRVREQVMAHVLRLPLAFFDRAITGQLVSRVTNDTESVKALYVQVLFVMLDSVIVLAGAAVAMAWLDLRLLAVVALLVPAVAGVVALYQRLSAPAVARTRALRSELNAHVAESIAGMAVLQAAGAAGRFGARFGTLNEAHYRSRRRELRANAWLLRPMLDLLNVLLLAGLIGAFGLRSQGGALGAAEIGVLYAFMGYLARVTEPLTQITMQFAQLQQALVGAARVQALLEQGEEAPPAVKAEAADPVPHGAVQIQALDFAYLPGRPVLHGIDLDLAAGSFTGIVGHTGSGKSTLMALLLRFYPAPAGSIRLDGVPLEQLGEDLLRTRIGLVPQEPFLLADTVRENIAMGRALSDAALQAAARDAGAADFIAALEQGWDTVLGEGGARLSTGQKQLLAIARALAGEPRILLLDEATSHIDSDTEQVVQQALARLHGRVTVIAIAHRLSTVRDADRIVVLNHGRLAESGRHDTLLALEGGIYRRLWELQQLEAVDAQEAQDAVPNARAQAADPSIAAFPARA